MNTLLDKAGAIVVADIIENINRGIDFTGKAFAYSKNPFYRPYDPKLYRKMGGKAAAEDGTLFKIIITGGKKAGGGKLGFIIMGYDAFKQKVYPNAYGHFLTVSGKLLRGMRVISKNNDELVIGWKDQDNVDKAFWLNQSGAGKGKKLWKFLGISEKQKNELVISLEAELKNIVQQAVDRMLPS
jgi:hypothetical protein